MDQGEREDLTMAYTEKEATRKFCPLVRISPGHTDSNFFSRCRGSECMMWRWSGGPNRHNYRNRICENVSATTEPERPADLPASWQFFPFVDTEGDPASWVEPESEWQARQRGYCGLVPPDFVKVECVRC